MQISRDVRFNEKLVWNWEKQLVEDVEPGYVVEAHNDAEEEDAELEMIDHVPVRGTKTLQDVYERCNIAVTEPCNSTEALGIAVWKDIIIS